MKRTKKSLKKIKSLFFLIIITVVIGITATYAWFSTQREVDITGMKLNVEVAESMQISLDGETWTQSIQIADMRQFYGTYVPTGDVDESTIFQAKKINDGTNQNYVPKELLPVSSAGELNNGQLQFVTGTLSNAGGTLKLTGITTCSEADFTGANKTATIAERETGNSSHPYLVFDMYLRNISKKADGEFDNLLLNAGSMAYLDTATVGNQEADAGVDGIIKVDADEAKSGLEYTPRVGMVVYGKTAASTETGETVRTLGPGTAEDTTDNDDKVAIWEPNHLNHTQAVVADNGREITMQQQAVDTYAIKTSAATASPNEIADVNATTGDNLVKVNTFKPSYTLPLYDNVNSEWKGGVSSSQIITDIAGANLGIEANKISKVRVYIWLEGQDPDCVELASTGDMLNVTLKLTKEPSNAVIENTYADDGASSGNTNQITAATLAASDYGKTVTNYTTGTRDYVGWKIFHSDGNQIYLIADDYVDPAYVPGEGKISGTGHAFAIGDNINDYDGSVDITSTHPAKKWLSQYTYTSTNDNMKATAYLMDTTLWSTVYANDSYASYAIGGPTLELFRDSYNVKHPGTTITTNADENGYKLKWSTDAGFSEALNGLADDNLYIINSQEYASAMYIASPASPNGGADATNKILGASITGLGYYAINDNTLGARPIVALRPGVKLERQENGNYEIVD